MYSDATAPVNPMFCGSKLRYGMDSRGKGVSCLIPNGGDAKVKEESHDDQLFVPNV